MVMTFSCITRAEHQITYYDCTRPTGIQKYSVSEACDQLQPPPPTTEPWQVYQIPLITRLTGTRCTIRKSTFYYTCGSWGHLKTATVPQILHTLPVSASWCRNLAHTRQFIPPGSTEKFPLAPDAVNVIAVEVTGKILRQNQAVSCQGEPGRIEGSIMPSILTLVEYHVTIQPEHYLINKVQVESLSDHVRLPANCASSQTYCETSSGTYIWTLPGPKCNLELVSAFQPRQEGSLLVDEKNKILINITDRALLPACGSREIHHTEFSHIVVLKGGDPIPGVNRVDPNDVRTDIFTASISAYTTFQLENRIGQISSSWRHQVCRNRWAQKPNEPQRLSPALWGMRRGDLIYTFNCPSKTANLLEADTCYVDIPIVADQPTWVDPISRLAKSHSAVTPCSKRLPLMVHTSTGWVEISPHIRRATAPTSSFPDDGPATQHEDVSQAGIYTANELEDWSLIVQYPDYEQAMVNEISLGSCSVTGKCGYQPGASAPGVRPYDLEQLINKSIKSLDIWQKIDQWILQHGSYLAALVLVLTLSSWLLKIILLATALIKEGPAQAIAMASLLCCSGPQNYGRLQRRRARQQQQREAEDQRLLFNLQPATAPNL